MNLKNQLIAHMKNDWQFSVDINADALADEMKEALASIDGILRDRLVLDGFAKLIASGKVSDEKCRVIFDELISDKYLLNGLGKECDDSIFGRAFSGYAISSLLDYSNGKDNKIFTKKDMLLAFHAVLKCFREEKDLRGFVYGKGWAHSIAHNADCLAGFAVDDNFGRDELLPVLSVIKEHVYRGHNSVIREYDRIQAPVLSMLERGIVSEKEFADWIADICVYERIGNVEEDTHLIMSRCEFMIFLRSDIKKKHPHLLCYVSDAIITLMEM